MTLTGKGFFIWQIRYCNGGDINSILYDVRKANLTHVLIKIADGVNKFNFDRESNFDLAKPLTDLLQSNGIQVWGWHYLRGTDPVNEARVSYERILELGLDGFVANAEYEFKTPGKDLVAKKFMEEMREALPDLPMALSSYRFPSYHPQFPYKEFLDYCDYNMPQIYWQGAHNPAGQLTRSISEYQDIEPNRPIIPTGSVYAYDGWEPTVEDVQAYLEAVTELGIPATNFWSWDNCRNILPNQWNVIRDYEWVDAPEENDVTDELIEALNSYDVLKIGSLYTQDGVHINANRTIQGTERIMSWYQTCFDQILPGAEFKLTNKTGSRNSRHFNWEATSNEGQVFNGKDTLGLRDGKISYHFTHFAGV
ncbi:MAG: nuclear transport factor 2 family protein [Chloroflexi bacterium]|jgi:hypothetical protein|nr:nuclear transport factor 2 family protein [Chloroflexota bacterium]MBT3668611.1 nuclear transport factor 2 family protein [Chloroflexota bacterium]MBT4003124.1 nuclear transport factor 2 family protein [Chloroflexota bacterium]MBT4306244.1 nuclear transport factor 2 family protein [Chloroflexota bacterium]MBT4532875.1 nuclear transport factor 2 family protein [Chloroflexota bacterium]